MVGLGRRCYLLQVARSPETPLILWVCAAVCAHFLFAEGGGEVARIHDDRKFMATLASEVRGATHGVEQSIEIMTSDDGKPDEKAPEEPKKPDLIANKKAEPPKPPEAKKLEDAKKPPPKTQETVKVELKEDDPLKKLDEPPPEDKRIAVKQHADPKQADNPTAKFIADEANTVKEETVATQTSHDQDDPNPTPGANKTAGPKDKTGDSEKTSIRDSEDHKGEKDRAPGEKGTEFDIQRDNKPIEKPMTKVAILAPPSPDVAKVGGDGRTPSAANQPPAPQLAPGTPPTQSEEVAQGQSGWSFNPIRPGALLPSPPTDPVPGTTNQKPPVAQNSGNTRWLGLGGKPGPGQVNLNLTQVGVVAVVGSDQLRKEREADGERRVSEHRGSWTASNFERWRNAIENYVSTVKPGNQTSLNTAAVPFASYLNAIHNRIHPLFADSFLGSLGNLPKTHPMNNTKLATSLEIVVSPKEGRIVKMGVVKTSGITAFDIAALDSVNRAQPFGPAPGAIVSPDGNVYLHWEFHRDEVFACSTMHARPFILNVPAKGPIAPDPPPPAPKTPGQERGAPPPVNVNETREGALPPDAAPPARRAG